MAEGMVHTTIEPIQAQPRISPMVGEMPVVVSPFAPEGSG